MSTHADWEKAREKRDRAANRIARAVLVSRSPSAQDIIDFALSDEEMERITKELDTEQ